ncbi:glycine--tRNA ligase [Candidatus Woesearchaeota archaeon]|nr:glycine--tRNA ligase [Candidatus Woesearchaeota archaeon]
MAAYEDIVNLALRRSLFYPASEIYANAPAGMYDYGPFGAAIRRKIADQWRKHLVQKENFLEIDGALIMPEDVFKASGHLTNFNDPVTQCKKCNTIHRADKLLEETTKKPYKEAMPVQELTQGLREHNLKCPKCKGELMDVKQFNMMVKADVGVGQKASCYLRPESCQTIFTNWDRLVKTMRVKLPKGVSQIGKVFRNEISPRQTLIRQVEFNQSESEVFFDPQEVNTIEHWEEVKDYKLRIQKADSNKTEDITADKLVKDKLVSGKLIAYYLARTQQLFEKLGIPVQNMRFRQLDDTERAFYAKEAYDFEVQTSLGWMELAANNYRTDYDLKGHANISKKDLNHTREDGSKFIPHIWEISIGFDRAFYAILEHSYNKQKERTWLSLPPTLAPIMAGIFPLLSNKPELVKKAEEVFAELQDCYDVQYDATGSIGKRYARMDEIGVPWCITIDFDSIKNEDVTIRARDSTAQKRIKIKDLRDTLYQLITGKISL